MGQDVSRYVQSCQSCQAVKPYKEIRPPMSKIRVPDTRFSELQIDVVGPMPPSEGMKYLLTIVDRTTRWIEAVPMTEANSSNCCKAFIRGWVQHFGLPSKTQSDNGNTFVSNLWKELHQTLGIKVDFTPPYHSASLGGIERKHRDIKLALKATLHEMGNEAKDQWMSRLPWILLAQRAAYQTDIDTTSAELVMGSNPVQPGDMHTDLDLSHTENLQQLVEGLRTNAAQPAHQTSAHREPPVNVPKDLDQVTHVRIKRAKPGPLGHTYEGPFKIVERQGKSCIKVRVGSFANGEPKFEVQHWANCRPAVFRGDVQETQRALPGRKPKEKGTTKTSTPDLPEDANVGPPPVSFNGLPTENTSNGENAFRTRYGREVKVPVRY